MTFLFLGADYKYSYLLTYLLIRIGLISTVGLAYTDAEYFSTRVRPICRLLAAAAAAAVPLVQLRALSRVLIIPHDSRAFGPRSSSLSISQIE